MPSMCVMGVPDVAADRGDAGSVTEAQGLVVLVGVHRVCEVAWQLDTGERRLCSEVYSAGLGRVREDWS